MKISVIVPYWNSEKWLGRCCESLHTQDGDFEFILVDDQSTDNGRDIAYEYCNKDQRFTLLTNHKTKGVSGARNTGIEYAEGDYITFLDADDEMADNAYKTFLSVINADPQADMHQFNHLRYYAVLEKMVIKYANHGGKYDVRHLPLMWFGVWNKIFRREFLKDVRFIEGLQYGEDGLFVLECLAKGAYIHHGCYDEVTVKHKFINSHSLSKSKDMEGMLKQVHEYENFLVRQTDPKMIGTVCRELSALWGAEPRIKAMGGE